MNHLLRLFGSLLTILLTILFAIQSEAEPLGLQGPAPTSGIINSQIRNLWQQTEGLISDNKIGWNVSSRGASLFKVTPAN